MQVDEVSPEDLKTYIQFLRRCVAHTGGVPAGLEALDAWLQAQSPAELRPPQPTSAGPQGAVPSSLEALLGSGGTEGTQGLGWVHGTQQWGVDQAALTHLAAGRGSGQAAPGGPASQQGPGGAPFVVQLIARDASAAAQQGAVGAAQGEAGTILQGEERARYPRVPAAGKVEEWGLHPDFMGVLCVCAAWVNVQPTVLLKAVSVLQKHMGEVESAVSKG